MNIDELLGVLESKKQRRSEKVRHLGLESPPLIYEITVAEKEAIHKAMDKCESVEVRDDLLMETVMKSMCGWDDVKAISAEQIERFKSVYSADVMIELYKCIVDFSYLGEKGVVAAKKS
jgi:dephospho-CoA kinase